MPRKFRVETIMAVVCLAALVGMATGCKKTPTGPATTVTLLSNAALDGYVGSNGVAVANATGPVTGDSDAVLPGVGLRQFFSFDLSSIPNGVTIQSASLQIYQALVSGTPYATLGNVIADRVDLGSALDSADYSGGTLTANIGTISTTTVVEYKSLDVATSVKADRSSSKSRSEFRVRFSVADSNNNGINDRVAFTDAEDSCCGVSRPPQLVVTYR